MSVLLNVPISAEELYLDPVNQYCMESMGCGLNPGSEWSNFENVTIIKPAPVSRTSDIANSAIKSPWRSLLRPADGPVRPPSLSDSPTLTEVVFKAGARPKMTPVKSETRNVNANAAVSRGMLAARGKSAGAMASREPNPRYRASNPKAPPASASKTLSV